MLLGFCDSQTVKVNKTLVIADSETVKITLIVRNQKVCFERIRQDREQNLPTRQSIKDQLNSWFFIYILVSI